MRGFAQRPPPGEQSHWDLASGLLTSSLDFPCPEMWAEVSDFL